MSRHAKPSAPIAQSAPRRAAPGAAPRARRASSAAGRKRRDQPSPTTAARGRQRREMHAHVEARGGGPRAERGAQQAAQREGGVEAREDRAPVTPLDGDAVGVHRHVQRAHRRAVGEGQEAQDARATARAPRPPSGQAEERERRARRGPAAEAGRGGTGQRHAEQRAGGDAGQREPELAVGQVRRSRTAGIRAAHEPNSSPLSRKIAATAWRAGRTGGGRSRVHHIDPEVAQGDDVLGRGIGDERVDAPGGGDRGRARRSRASPPS